MPSLSSSHLLIGAVAAAALFGCYGMAGTTATADPNAPTVDGNGNPIITDVPCDVETILANYCWSCHGVTPSGGAPSRLVTYGDLTSPSVSDSSVSAAARALARLQDGTMPSAGPKPTQAEIDAFAAWVGNGTPKGTSCDTTPTPGTNPYDTPLTCTTGKNSNISEGSTMEPGGACISCHATYGVRKFSIAGTVYPTAHETDRCVGTASIQIVITDKNNKVFTTTSNSVGNFSLQPSQMAGFAPPYTAKIVQGANERAMTTAQTSGDCNSCHTEMGSGTPAAPGRIMAP